MLCSFVLLCKTSWPVPYCAFYDDFFNKRGLCVMHIIFLLTYWIIIYFGSLWLLGIARLKTYFHFLCKFIYFHWPLRTFWNQILWIDLYVKLCGTQIILLLLLGGFNGFDSALSVTRGLREQKNWILLKGNNIIQFWPVVVSSLPWISFIFSFPFSAEILYCQAHSCPVIVETSPPFFTEPYIYKSTCLSKDAHIKWWSSTSILMWEAAEVASSNYYFKSIRQYRGEGFAFLLFVW